MLRAPGDSSDKQGVIYFFRRGEESRTVETRLNPNGLGYELVIIEKDTSRIEAFATLAPVLEREYDLLHAWRAQGWREVRAPARRRPPLAHGERR